MLKTTKESRDAYDAVNLLRAVTNELDAVQPAYSLHDGDARPHSSMHRLTLIAWAKACARSLSTHIDMLGACADLAPSEIAELGRLERARHVAKYLADYWQDCAETD
jgi:hypothetical protein